MIHRPMFCLATLVALAATTAIAGLFDSTPSEANAEGYWRGRFSNSNGLLQMTSFKKTDGKTTGDVYTLYYTLTYTVTEDCEYDRDFKTTRGLPQTEMQKLASMFEKVSGHKGQQLFQTGEMLYEKRESGWQLIRIENTNVVESNVTAQKRATEEERQRQEVVQQQQEEQARKANLIAKAHEDHKIVKTVTVKTDHDSSEGVFAPPAKLKLILSDSNITLESGNRKQVVWFGDIKRLEPHSFGNEWNAHSLDVNYYLPTAYFPSAAERDDFYKICVETIEQWREQNSDLGGGPMSPGGRVQGTKNTSNAGPTSRTVAERIIGTWGKDQDTLTYNNDGTGVLIESRGKADFTWSIDGEALVINYTAFNGVPPEKKVINRGRLTDFSDSEYKWVDYGGGKVFVWKRIKQ